MERSTRFYVQQGLYATLMLTLAGGMLALGIFARMTGDPRPGLIAASLVIMLVIVAAFSSSICDRMVSDRLAVMRAGPEYPRVRGAFARHLAILVGTHLQLPNDGTTTFFDTTIGWLEHKGTTNSEPILRELSEQARHATMRELRAGFITCRAIQRLPMSNVALPKMSAHQRLALAKWHA